MRRGRSRRRKRRRRRRSSSSSSSSRRNRTENKVSNLGLQSGILSFKKRNVLKMLRKFGLQLSVFSLKKRKRLSNGNMIGTVLVELGIGFVENGAELMKIFVGGSFQSVD